jgi:hypothetical protein
VDAGRFQEAYEMGLKLGTPEALALAAKGAKYPTAAFAAVGALAQSPINTSALAMAEGQDFAHDTLYRALNQPRGPPS